MKDAFYQHIPWCVCMYVCMYVCMWLCLIVLPLFTLLLHMEVITSDQSSL
jgi:hypothetical protein